MDKFFKIVSGVLRINQENLNWNLKREETGTWDSLAHIALVAELEDELGIDIPIEEVPEIIVLSDFKKYLGE